MVCLQKISSFCIDLESVLINLLQRMNALDTSEHQLNISTSKQRYSFSKQPRFNQLGEKILCDSFYDLPTTKTRRATTLGYGQKNMGITKASTPGAGTYNIQNGINPEKHKYDVVTFGFSRDQMELGGPLGQVKYFSKLPGPGAYSNLSRRDMRAPSLRSRLPDHSLDYALKNPGPGTYKLENMGSSNYYITSKYRNFTNGKMPQGVRLNPVSRRQQSVGPAEYKDVDGLNLIGRYNQAKHLSSRSCVFSKSERQGLVDKTKSFIPGPGHYPSFSSFG